MTPSARTPWTALRSGVPCILIASLVAPAALADSPAPPSAAERAQVEVAALEGEGLSLQTALRGARANRDATRAACLDDALTRMHVATRTARALREAIGQAARSGDGRGVERELIRIVHLGERGRYLFAQAQKCGSSEVGVYGERTTVTARAPDWPPGTDAFPHPPSPR